MMIMVLETILLLIKLTSTCIITQTRAFQNLHFWEYKRNDKMLYIKEAIALTHLVYNIYVDPT